MDVKAVSKDTGISPRKVRPLVDMVRGKRVDEALVLLQFAPTPAARVVAKTVKSAVANADNVFQMETADLKIVKIFADEARTLKRSRPRAKGRSNTILKRSSHITVFVAEKRD